MNTQLSVEQRNEEKNPLRLILYTIIVLIFISCSSQEEQIAELPVDTSTTLETIAPTTSTTLETTTTTQVVYDG